MRKRNISPISDVEKYKIRRANRIMSRLDADDEDGHWVTTNEGNKLHINGEGEPDKGNPYVLAAAKGESKSNKSKDKSATTSVKAVYNKNTKETDYVDQDTGEIVKIGLPNGDVIHPTTGKVIERGDRSKSLLEQDAQNPDNPKRPSFSKCKKAWRDGLAGIAGEMWETVTNDSFVFRFPAGTKLADCTSAMSNQLRKNGYSTDVLKPGKISIKDPKDEWHSVEISIGKDSDNSMKGKSFYYIDISEVF